MNWVDDIVDLLANLFCQIYKWMNGKVSGPPKPRRRKLVPPRIDCVASSRDHRPQGTTELWRD